MNEHVNPSLLACSIAAIDTTQLAISVAVAVADAPFAELEYQSRQLAEIVSYGFMTKQAAIDMAYTAALGSGMVHRHGADVVQEIIAAGFDEEASNER